jgi:Uma2 family endonuclease
MSLSLPRPWTRTQFLAWADAQETRYEFDGAAPVAMTGGTAAHAAITTNLLAALRARLRGTPCRPLGPDAGLETVNGAIRYPDALVTRGSFHPDDRLIPGVVAVFEVVSASSSRIDRIVKLREYGEVGSIRTYGILESQSREVTFLARTAAGEAFRATVLTEADTLRLPDLGIDIPVAELYEDLDFPAAF